MNRVVIMVAIGAVAALAVAGTAYAQSQGNTQATPTNFNYVIKDGKRVPKPNNRVVNADGTWREETKAGACVEVKERGKDGSVKTTRKCD